VELKHEIDQAVAAWGEKCFQREVRRRAPAFPGLDWAEAEPPWYETYGRKMIAQGRYQDLITYQEHLQPVAQALRAWSLLD
jgi:hypothetical protein